MNDITPKEAIANLNHLYGMVAPDIQRSLDVAIKALENPTGDCISREALKANMKKAEEQADTFEMLVEFYEQIIDNASPVETFTLEDMQNNFDLGAMSENGKHDRPKGEWIKHINNLFPEESTEECPFCHEEQLLRLGNDDNFCPNCGADMRGGAE